MEKNCRHRIELWRHCLPALVSRPARAARSGNTHARYVEFFPDDQVLNFRRLVDTQLKTKDGMLILPKTPGLGFGFDEKAVARYALKDGQSVWKMLKVK